jgi:hypothetical protein
MMIRHDSDDEEPGIPEWYDHLIDMVVIGLIVGALIILGVYVMTSLNKPEPARIDLYCPNGQVKHINTSLTTIDLNKLCDLRSGVEPTS